jgi:hypothetical protein
MFEHMDFKLAPATRSALKGLLKSTKSALSEADVVELAVQQWIEQAVRENPDAAAKAACGYQWKSLFLPEGTLLRMQYKGEYHTADVRGNRISYQGRTLSPRQFVMHLTGSVRNAWRELWIRCPGEVRWHLADVRRRILRREPRLPRAPAAKLAPLPAAQLSEACQQARARQRELMAWRETAFLRRDDAVRDDQPDLSAPNWGQNKFHSYIAGRPGPRDRRLGPRCPAH